MTIWGWLAGDMQGGALALAIASPAMANSIARNADDIFILSIRCTGFGAASPFD